MTMPEGDPLSRMTKGNSVTTNVQLQDKSQTAAVFQIENLPLPKYLLISGGQILFHDPEKKIYKIR